MSKEIKIKYILDGKETEKELIDWNTTKTTMVGDVAYVNTVDKSNCGMSTRHKLCNSHYEHPLKDSFSFSFLGEELKGFSRCSESFIENEPYDVKLPYCGEIEKSTGVKHNKLKAPLDIVQTRQFPKALQLLALATAYGNHKYSATDKDFLNFKRVEGGSQTYFDAMARHSTNRNGIDESGLHHIIHSTWGALASLEIWAEENEINIEEYSKEYLSNLK